MADLTNAKELSSEERLQALRTAYTEGLAAQIARNREVVAELRKAESVSKQLVELNNELIARLSALERTFTQVVGVMLDKLPDKTIVLMVEDLMRLDGAEIEAQEVDGKYAYHLKT